MPAARSIALCAGLVALARGAAPAVEAQDEISGFMHMGDAEAQNYLPTASEAQVRANDAAAKLQQDAQDLADQYKTFLHDNFVQPKVDGAPSFENFMDYQKYMKVTAEQDSAAATAKSQDALEAWKAKEKKVVESEVPQSLQAYADAEVDQDFIYNSQRLAGKNATEPPAKAEDCTTVSELKAWKTTKEGWIKKFVPSFMHSFVFGSIDKEYKANLARIQAEEKAKAEEEKKEAAEEKKKEEEKEEEEKKEEEKKEEEKKEEEKKKDDDDDKKDDDKPKTKDHDSKDDKKDSPKLEAQAVSLAAARKTSKAHLVIPGIFAAGLVIPVTLGLSSFLFGRTRREEVIATTPFLRFDSSDDMA